MTEKIVKFAIIVGEDVPTVLQLIEQGILTDNPAPETSARFKEIVARLEKNPDAAVSQEDFAVLWGMDHSVVSRLITRGVLPKGGTLSTWIRCFKSYQLGLQAGRRGTGV